jgi:hypothetical protein
VISKGKCLRPLGEIIGNNWYIFIAASRSGNMLSKHVKEDQKNWDDELLFLMMAYRCSVNETTGFLLSEMLSSIFVSRRKRIGFDNFPLGGTPQTLYR